MNERELFTAALEITDPVERARFLEQNCEGNTELRQRVEHLLATQPHVGDFLDRPVAGFQVGLFQRHSPWQASDRGQDVGLLDAKLQPGTQIGNYRLLEPIGRGGMGQVWKAEQEQPVRRTVALKVINPGMDSQALLARFDAERCALELMDHHNIARLLDAGATDDGRPYFVMELVRGVTVTEYCDQRHLDVSQRLQLFADVCQAVQHAHQKGIIHRDLKPSNVLVANDNEQAVVKVIDFGIAKAMHDRLTEKTLYTQFGQVVGTLEYMSPEQARLNHLDIDTRSDIYSLGVLLYELLTGATPFERQRLREAAFDEMLRVIREEEPPRPSDKLSLSDTLPSVAANRAVEPARLSRLVRGDLDWVVMKALEKDRDRRYASASAFAADIERYLQDEPVSAGPPSPAYRARKFLRRNRKSVLAGAIILLSLVAGLVATIWSWREARQAAEAERVARTTAESRLTQIDKGIQILAAIFDDLNPDTERKEEKPLRAVLADRLNEAASQLADGDIGDPVAVARLQVRLATSLKSLGFPELAVELFRAAKQTLQLHLGAEDESVLDSVDQIASCFKAMGQFENASSMLTNNMAIRQRVGGPMDLKTLATSNNIAGIYRQAGKFREAAALYEQTLAILQEHFGMDHLATLSTANNLALAWIDLGETTRAIPLLEEVLARRQARLGENHPETASTIMALAGAFGETGNYERSAALVETSLKIRRKTLGPDHPETLRAMSNLGVILQKLNKTDQAIPILEENLRRRQVKLGADHPDTLMSMNHLAIAYKRVGKTDLAIPLYQQALEQRRRTLGARHPDTLTSMNNLAAAYSTRREFDLAIPMLEETLSLRKETLGNSHPETLQTMGNLAFAYQQTNKRQQALSLYQDQLRLRENALGADHPDNLLSMYSLAVALRATGQFQEAIEIAERALDLAVKRGGAMPEGANELPRILAKLYQDVQRYEDAEHILRQALSDRQNQFGRHEPKSAQLLADLGGLLFLQEKYTEAESVVRECLDVQQEKEPDTWSTFHTQCLLGAILMRQGDYEQADPLLKEGYAGMQRRSQRVSILERAPRLEEVQGWLAEMRHKSNSAEPR